MVHILLLVVCNVFIGQKNPFFCKVIVKNNDVNSLATGEMFAKWGHHHGIFFSMAARLSKVYIGDGEMFAEWGHHHGISFSVSPI